ncbi:hypothetical protein ACFWFU_05840 [Streptomyces sp. NPDC060235]|uniref:5'-methylthioadenosine/S-adenosylhomocysteine nucleosidase family protein n=1 Tax=Streptomyces sp. NPDC060235 TaxID=3347080 RepID=UPI0036580312
MDGNLGEDPPTPDVVVFTALAEEHRAVLAALAPCVRHPWRGQDLHMANVDGLQILVIPRSGMGNVGIAEIAARAIGVWNPAKLLLVGIAGGIRDAGDDLRLGDVLVPDKVIGFEHARVSAAGTSPRYEPYRPDWDLLSTAQAVVPEEWVLPSLVRPRVGAAPDRAAPRAHFGPVLSGEKVIAGDAILDVPLKAWPKALGVEMESLGVALASYRGGPGFLMVKSVCDFADAQKNDDWHDYAAATAAQFSVAVLRRYAARRSAEAKPGRPQAFPLSGPPVYPGALKVQICRRLVDDWEELADYFETPIHTRRKFPPGNEARAMWEWLEVRHKLHLLPQALSEIGRQDLKSDLEKYAT